MLPIEPNKSSLRGEEKEVPFAQSECGKKKPACVYTGTHAGFDRICLSMRNCCGRPTEFVGHHK